MAIAFDKMKVGDKLFRIDITRDDNGNVIDFVRHDLEIARDTGLCDYMVKFLCYDKTFNNAAVAFRRDVGINNSSKSFYDDNKNMIMYLTTSKRNADLTCKELDEKLNKNDKEGQDN